MSSRTLLPLALLIATQLCRADDANPYTITAQPSIFWRNGQWQTFQDGQWIPYSAPKRAEMITEPEMPIAPPLHAQPENVQANDYPDYYGGYGYPYGFRLHGHHFNKRPRNNNAKDDPFFTQPNAGLGSTTIGIGQPNGGIGQTTIGIGQPLFAPREKSIGLRQQGTPSGHTRPGSGQINGGIAQSTTGAGQRTVATGQQSGTVQHASAAHSESQHRR